MPSAPFGASRLLSGADCDVVLERIVTVALERVTAWGLDQPYDWRVMPVEVMATDDIAMAESAATDAGSAPAFSDTNTQEAGVDEADTVETDGRVLYTVDENGVTIIDIATATVLATINLEPADHRLLLADGILTVISSPWSRWNTTVITRADITDPSRPITVRTDELEGSLIAARSADGVVRVILRSAISDRLNFVTPDGFGLDEERALIRNREIVAASSIDDWLPRRLADDGSVVSAVDCADVAIPDTGADIAMTWVASIDLSDTGPAVGSIALAGRADTVYATARSLHTATTDWDGSDRDTTTVVHSFSMGSTTAITHVASGEVPGHLIGQFALSEYLGDLRVASTHTVDGVSRSRVAVLRPSDGELVEVGAVEDLGLTEQIYAVRYIGPLAYVVTFRQVDPLYVLDLTDPAAPVMRGELKIPGYSSYLHPIGEGRLLGLGQDASEQGVTTGTQLSLFDVSDPATPARVDQVLIGGWSEAEWNHLAFLYWPADGTVAVPRSDGGVFVGRVSGDSIEVIGDLGPTAATLGAADAGISASDDPLPTEPGRWDYCWDPVQRALVVGDELITVAMTGVAMHALDDLSLRRGLTLRNDWC